MTRPVPDCAVRFVEEEEACVLRVYDDAQPRRVLKPGDTVIGTLTAGVGHTGGLSIGQKVTSADAEAWLRMDLGTAASRLAGRVDEAVILGLNDNQYAALLSFVFNLGASPGWGIWKLLNAGHLDAVPGEMMRFVNAGGKKLPGLVKRRTDEVALWNRPAPGVVALKSDAPPSSVTRATDTPPTPVPPKPLAAPSLTTKIAGGVAAVGAGATQVHSLVAPHINVDPVFAKVAAGLIGVTIVCSAVGLWIAHEQHKAAQC